MLKGDILSVGNTADCRDSLEGNVVCCRATVNDGVEVLTEDIGVVVLAVYGTNHSDSAVLTGHVVLYVTHVINEVCSVVNVRCKRGSVPHKVGNDLDAGEDQGRSVVTCELVVAGSGDMLVGSVVVIIVLLLENGCIEGCEGYVNQLIAGVERLVSDSGYGIGENCAGGISACKGVGGNSHGAVCDPCNSVAGPKYELKTVRNDLVYRAVDDLYAVADVVGEDLGAFNHLAVEGFLDDGGEGSHDTHSEGVVTYVGELLAESYGEERCGFLDKGALADVGCRRKISLCKCRVCECVVANVACLLLACKARKRRAVGECALADGSGVGQGNGGERIVVAECVSGDGGCGIESKSSERTLCESGLSEGGHVLKVDAVECCALLECALGNLGQACAEGDGGQIPAKGERGFSELGKRGEIHRGELRRVVAVDVITVNYRGLAAVLILILVMNVAGECIFPDGKRAGQIDAFEGRRVEESVVADFSTVAESNADQLCRACKRLISYLDVLADGESVQGRGVYVVESVSGGAYRVFLDLPVVLAQGERHLSKLCIITHHYGGELVAVGECANANLHSRRNYDGGNVGSCKCIVTDNSEVVEGGKSGDGSILEGVVTDLGKRAERNRCEPAAGGECIVTDDGNVRHNYVRDIVVSGECAVADSRNAVELEGAGECGCNDQQGGSRTVENAAAGVGLEGSVAVCNVEAFNLGISEGVLADNGYVSAEIYRGKVATVIERACRNNGSVDGNRGEL